MSCDNLTANAKKSMESFGSAPVSMKQMQGVLPAYDHIMSQPTNGNNQVALKRTVGVLNDIRNREPLKRFSRKFQFTTDPKDDVNISITTYDCGNTKDGKLKVGFTFSVNGNLMNADYLGIPGMQSMDGIETIYAILDFETNNSSEFDDERSDMHNDWSKSSSAEQLGGWSMEQQEKVDNKKR